MISYEPLWKTMKEKNITMYRLIKYYKISGNTLYRMNGGKGVSSITIDDLCRVLNCNVSDIIEYIEE